MENKHNIANVNPFEEVDEFRAYAEQIADLQRQVKILMECVTLLMRERNGLQAESGKSGLASTAENKA